MIEWAVDALLYILLLAAIGFGGISVIGLLLFPDIRSRAFTGLRAGILAITLITALKSAMAFLPGLPTAGSSTFLLVFAAALILFIVVILTGLPQRQSAIMPCRSHHIPTKRKISRNLFCSSGLAGISDDIQASGNWQLHSIMTPRMMSPDLPARVLVRETRPGV